MANDVFEKVKKIIIQVLQKYLNKEQIIDIQKVLNSIPIIMGDDIDKYLHDSYARAEAKGTRDHGYAILLPSDISDNIDDIATIVHELAHYFSTKISINKLGNLKRNDIFEEAMAVNFSEFIINEYFNDCLSHEKDIDINVGDEVIQHGYTEDSSIYYYQRKILNTIMYLVRANNKDLTIMLEYLFGNKENIIPICCEVLGNDFAEIMNYIDEFIRKYNLNSDGYGFTDEKIIRILYKQVEKKLLALINKLNISREINNDSDYKDNNTRYYQLGGIVKKAQIIQEYSFNREKILQDLSSKYNKPYELLDSSLTSYCIRFILNNKDSEDLLGFYIERHEEMGYSIPTLIGYGFTEDEITEWIYNDKKHQEIALEIELKNKEIDCSLEDLDNFGLNREEINELLANNHSKEIADKIIIKRIVINAIKRNYIPCASGMSAKEMEEFIRTSITDNLINRGFSNAEIDEIIADSFAEESQKVANITELSSDSR